MQAKIMATILGLVDEIEREFIRMRTKLAACKMKGQILGVGKDQKSA